MANGSFVLMLHSHLPYYRKAGVWPFGEENLFECMAECYVPLVCLLQDLVAEGLTPNITLGITPVLAEQLADPYLQKGFLTYLETKADKAAQDVVRFEDNEPLKALAQYQEAWFRQRSQWFEKRLNSNLLQAFSRLQQLGAIELVTSAATHAILPLLNSDDSLMAQIRLGKQSYEKHFGCKPKGFWLPECAYRPAKEAWQLGEERPYKREGLETLLEAEGFNYVFTEYHALDGASSTSMIRQNPAIFANPASAMSSSTRQQLEQLGTYEPYLLGQSKVAVMGRNNEASFQVWSSSYGYPGDGAYREFYKTDDTSGMRYWKLTDKGFDLGGKHLYNPEEAKAKAHEHAQHFVALVQKICQQQQVVTGQANSLVCAAFDTELFGHWWFEGMEWLGQVLRLMLKQPEAVKMQQASSFLAETPAKRSIDLPECTWGEGGQFWVWSNNQVDWMWTAIADVEARMKQLLERYPSKPPQETSTEEALEQRVLKQALRELLLLQASDWPFLVTTYQAKDYAIQRFESHRANFWQLTAQLESKNISLASLCAMEEKNCLFGSLSLDVFRPLTAPVGVMAS